MENQALLHIIWHLYEYDNSLAYITSINLYKKLQLELIGILGIDFMTIDPGHC